MPRINSPYTYSDTELLTVHAISKLKALASSHWNDATLTDLKLKIKKYYRKKQDGKCCYCGYPLPKHARGYDLEHIIPRDQAVCYMLWPKNLAASCIDCNFAKGSIFTTVQTSIKKKTYPDWRDINIVHPHFDEYDEHISVMCGLYLSLQEKGANTIAFCNLTRFHESALRKIAEYDDEDTYVKLLELRINAKKEEDKALFDGFIAQYSKNRASSLESILAAM